ncbi:hypothetical protein ROHU_007737 [Labeo rohita]|uniref:Uncharacterized protein n=1 Tax=Labeo rohita TaxID=84645 RepID=A0A498MC26_LABRO|nr:hypothetical protein ROHU_007737 [Labeo rohita]
MSITTIFQFTGSCQGNGDGKRIISSQSLFTAQHRSTLGKLRTASGARAYRSHINDFEYRLSMVVVPSEMHYGRLSRSCKRVFDKMKWAMSPHAFVGLLPAFTTKVVLPTKGLNVRTTKGKPPCRGLDGTLPYGNNGSSGSAGEPGVDCDGMN